MKYIISFLCFFILPVSVWAADACTNPDEYTVDKRCYVTDEQKKEKPYNAVAVVLDDTGEKCGSGTVVEKKGWLYLYTSKSVKEGCRAGYSGTIMLPNGEKHTIFFRDSGSADVDKSRTEGIYKGTNEETGNWAIYAIHDKNLPSVNISDKTLTKRVEIPHKVTTVGMNMIKIMSDKDIEEFRRKYVAYMRDNKKIWKGLSKDMAESYAKDIHNQTYLPINIKNDDVEDGYGKEFYNYLRNNQRSYFLSIFLPRSKRFLSVSRCVYKSNNKLEEGCQAGAGASGAGVFDEDSNLVGMVIGGYNYISGPNHLRVDYVTPVLRNPGQQIKHGLGKAAEAVANVVDACIDAVCGDKK